MDPISATIGVVGLATSIAGTLTSMQGARQVTEAQNKITGLEQQQEAVRNRQVNLQAGRMQLQNTRQELLARSRARSAAANQGASSSSGLFGGYGSIGGEAGTNRTATGQNLEIANQYFGLSGQISQQKIALAGAESTVNTGAGISAIGGAIGGSQNALTGLAKNFFNPTGGLSSSV